MLPESTLDFFNQLSGILRFELSKPAQPLPGMLNEVAEPDARLEKLWLEIKGVLVEDGEPRELTEQEWEQPVLDQPHVNLRAESGEIMSHPAPNGSFFTVRDLIHAVEATEFSTRGNSDWFGGIDVHHCYFEGIHPDQEEPDVWEICWGS